MYLCFKNNFHLKIKLTTWLNDLSKNFSKKTVFVNIQYDTNSIINLKSDISKIYFFAKT